MASEKSDLLTGEAGEAKILPHIKDVELEPKVEAIETLLQPGGMSSKRAIAFLICLFGLGMVAYHLFMGAFGGPEAFAYRSTHSKPPMRNSGPPPRNRAFTCGGDS